MLNLERTGDLLFDYFVYLKVNLDLEKTNPLDESSATFTFVAVNLDSIVTPKKGELNLDLLIFIERVNRGKDLRLVGSRCPLTRALGQLCFLSNFWRVVLTGVRRRTRSHTAHTRRFCGTWANFVVWVIFGELFFERFDQILKVIFGE